jgi:hypothetical protein
MTDYAMTLALRGNVITIDYDCWVIVEIDRDGRVLAHRMADEPRHDWPGVALHRWFDGSALQEKISEFWERGWM